MPVITSGGSQCPDAVYRNSAHYLQRYASVSP